MNTVCYYQDKIKRVKRMIILCAIIMVAIWIIDDSKMWYGLGLFGASVVFANIYSRYIVRQYKNDQIAMKRGAIPMEIYPMDSQRQYAQTLNPMQRAMHDRYYRLPHEEF